MREVKWPKVKDFQCWNKLKILRKALDLKSIDIASGSGVTQAMVSLLENGHENLVSENVKRKISAFLDVPFSDLFPCEMIGNKPVPSTPKKAKGPILVQIQEFREK